MERGERAERACESCGVPDDELVLVRRVYLDAASMRVNHIDPTAELWCLSCSSQYPHQPAEGA